MITGVIAMWSDSELERWERAIHQCSQSLNKAIDGYLARLRTLQRTAQGAGTDKVLTLREAAERTRVAPATLKARFRAGRIPFLFRQGGRYYASEQKLELYLKQRQRR